VRVAALADIHGNLPALDHVLEPPDPDETTVSCGKLRGA
jgi:hypothetical protein